MSSLLTWRHLASRSGRLGDLGDQSFQAVWRLTPLAGHLKGRGLISLLPKGSGGIESRPIGEHGAPASAASAAWPGQGSQEQVPGHREGHA